MAWYRTIVTKNITVRLPDELAADAEALARVEGKSLNETVEESLAPTVAQRRSDPEIKARVARIIEKDRLGGLLRPLTGQA